VNQKGEHMMTALGNTGMTVSRLGLSASYRPGKQAIYKALDEGVNYFFAYGFDGQMTSTMLDVVKTKRSDIVLATGAYNLIWAYPNLRRTLEKRLRQFGTEYLDVFLFLGVMKPKEFPPQALEEMQRFKEEGKVRAIGMSCHDRKFAGEMAAKNALDVLMIRYNAAHRGAEQDIFPNVQNKNVGIVGYTATRWSYLLRRPRNYPKNERVPTASECYRFVLSNPNVDVCMTAPKKLRELEENIAGVRRGALNQDDMSFMKSFGDVVYRQQKWFM
jgi:aryl-alcohol dehydrogenase-like predicted oxidoreductase